MAMDEHQDRTTQIVEAVERLLARGGVNAVTMRAVAAEAGVSLRLVQYYGSTKDELLKVTLERFSARSVARWLHRTDGAKPSALETLRAFADEALPTDDQSREFHRLGVSLESLAMTHPDVARLAYRAHLGGVAAHLRDALSADDSDSERLALEFMALVHGVGSLLMVDAISLTNARRLVEDHLDRLAPDLP